MGWCVSSAHQKAENDLSAVLARPRIAGGPRAEGVRQIKPLLCSHNTLSKNNGSATMEIIVEITTMLAASCGSLP